MGRSDLSRGRDIGAECFVSAMGAYSLPDHPWEGFGNQLGEALYRQPAVRPSFRQVSSPPTVPRCSAGGGPRPP